MKAHHALHAFSLLAIPLSVFIACGSSKDRSSFVEPQEEGGVVFAEGGLEGGLPPGIGGR